MISLEKKRNKIFRLNLFRLCFFLILCVILLVSLFFIKGLFITLLLAFILNFSLRPLVNLFVRLGLPRSLAVPSVFISILGGLGVVFVRSFPFLSNQFSRLKKEFPTYEQKFSLLITEWQSKFEQHFFNTNGIDLSKKLESMFTSFGETFLQEIPSLVTQSFTIFLLAPFFAYFFVKNELGLTRGLFSWVPNHIFEVFLKIHYEVNKQVGVFIRARLLEAVLVGSFVGTGLALIGLPFAVLLGIFVSITNLIPYLGPIIGALPILLVALVNDYETARILFILCFVFSAHVIDSMIIVPILLARIVNLHPLTVIIIIIAGGQFMGVLGMVISIPLANALKVSAMTVYNHISENI